MPRQVNNISKLITLRLTLALVMLCVFSGAVWAQTTVTDACGNKYGTVQIGDQVWLTENMRCNKYDSQSERKGATIPTSNTTLYTPYYKTGSNGHLYNWSAAVGLTTEVQVKAQTSEFSGRRQGICPNGWHVPTSAEYDALISSVKKSDVFSARPLKSKTGWRTCDITIMVGGVVVSPVGTDACGFHALPTGEYNCSLNYKNQIECKVWSPWGFFSWSTSSYDNEKAYYLTFDECSLYAYQYQYDKKGAVAVRCVKNKYTVKFVNWNGTVLQTQELYADATPRYTGSTPTRAADAQYTYTFKGWSPTVAKVTGDVTYTAQFTSKVRSYTIRFMNGNTVLESKSVAYGTKPTYTKATPTKTATAQYTYTFSGWNPNVVNVTKAQDYQAQFTSTVRSYTIRFMNGTTVLESKSVAYGTKPTYTKATPTKTATAQYTYTFSGWNPNVVNVTKAQDYQAQFTSTVRSYTIRFMNGTTVLESKSAAYGTKPTYTKSTPTKAATAQYTYTFSGWNPTIANVSKAQDYQAQFTSTVRSYTIRFLNGSSVLQNTSVAYGSKPKYTGSTPTKSSTAEYSYTFSGWSPAIANVSGAKDYTAQFTSSKRKYVIKFVNYDGTVLQSSEWEYGTTPKYTGKSPVRPDDAYGKNYEFTGWDKSVTPVSGSKTYTAKFTGAINDKPENEHSIGVVTDICGNKYNVVKIGSQLWLAENMRCNKYDTESERKDAVVPKGSGSGNSYSYSPYYQVYPAPSNENNWNGNLLDSQIPYLGVFFSWSAAVGFSTSDEALAQTKPFESSRQGICPNGWHLPTTDEWHELVDFIEKTDGKGEGTAGKHLKTTTGWYNNSNGLDTYGFSALPADRADLKSTYGVGGWGKWWTPDATSQSNVNTVQVHHRGDNFMFGANEVKQKNVALCVRCVKNPEKFEVKFVNYDGEELQSSEVEYGVTPAYTGETPEKPADAENTYVFTGWSPSIESVTKAQIYTAQFSNTTNKYLIRFLNEDGTELQSEELAYGATPAYTGETPNKEASAQYTYTFKGWDSEIAEVTGAKDYRATYTSTTNKYLITFENYNGDELQSGELEYGQTPSYSGEAPEKPADAENTYIFTGWSPSIESVTEAKTYTAQFSNTTNKYLITFENYNGEELQSGEVEYGVTPTYSGEVPEKPADAENTYVFTGWSPSIESVTEAKTYTAQFSSTANKYLIRFLNDDGTELQNEELAYGATPAYTGETPTKDATAQYTYTFAGWDSEIVEVTGAKDYTSTYTPTTNKYLITFENYNGEELQSSEVEYGVTPAYSGETPEKPADAENTYIFTGWSPSIESVTKAQTYTAQFSNTTNKYLIRFLNEDGTELQSEELAYGVTPAYTGETPTKEATAQYTYTFAGWDSDIVEVTGAKDYTSTYTPTTNKYLITFENYDGEELQSSEVEYGVTPAYTGETPEKPADAENTYVFTGWSPSIESVTKAQIYTAQFSNTTNKYLIRFLNEDGTELQSEELAYGATPAYTGETPNKEASAQYTYTFKGWDSEIVAVTGAKDYTAIYTPTTNKYLITFENYNGEELQSSEVEYGVTPAYTGEAPEKPADAENTYVFTGWSPSIESVTEAKTYTAQFSSTTNKYLIRFLNEDGTELQSEELAYGTTPVYTGETPVKDATAQYTYTFKGWDSEIVAVTGAKDYKATYTSTTNKYLITFVNYDGTELQSGDVEYGQSPAYTGATPVKPADAENSYTFSGWSPNITAVTGAQTYTAVFTKVLNTYTVTAEVIGDGGTVSGGGTYSYGTEVTLTATPEHGYHVSKWSTGETSAEIKITVTEDMAFIVSFIHQTADNTPECANAPAVAKYDWLLMLNANALKDKGYNLNENIVDWYRVVGEMDNLDSGERDDEKVGSGYYYTINSKLNDTGDYYALIDLPWQTTEVGCSGLMRTVVFHYAPKGTTKRAMAVSPTITYPEQQIEIVNLPKEEVEVYVYDVAGRLYRSFRTDGEPAAAFKAEPMAGTYIVVVWTSKGKETFKYIVRKR